MNDDVIIPIEDVKFRKYHENLPDDVKDKIKSLYNSVGRYICPNLEEWHAGFYYELQPKKELEVWDKIALAWKKYRDKYCPNKKISFDKGQLLIAGLVAISMGMITRHKKIPVKVMKRLTECYIETSR